MAKILPFKGVRYNSQVIGDIRNVVAPPYDIISNEEQEQLYNNSDYNVIRLENGKSLDSDTDTDNKYTRTGDTFKKWLDSKVLVSEEKPAFYIYEQVFTQNESEKSLKGIIAAVQIEEFSKGIIFPHEETLPKAKTDRFELMKATGANFSPIYSLYLDKSKSISSIIRECSLGKPDVSFTDSAGIEQNLWVVQNDAALLEISRLFDDKQLFIADGHHRYETALKYRDYMREQTGSDAPAPYDNIMMMLVDMEDDGLVVFPTHRLVRNLQNFNEHTLINMLVDNFMVSKIHLTDDNYSETIMERLLPHVDEKLFAIYTGERYYYLLECKNLGVMDEFYADKSKAFRYLDVNILHKLILNDILGIDAENVANQTNLTYTRDAKECIDLIGNGEYQCSILLRSTKISEIRDISMAGEKMPQKSTYFWPKLTTGLVINKL